MHATALLIPAAQAILNGLIPLVTDQIKLAWGFEKDLGKLQRMLEHIQALLRDAEKGHIESEVLKEWLKSLKSASCDAENVLGEFAYEALRRKLEIGIRRRRKVFKILERCWEEGQFCLTSLRKLGIGPFSKLKTCNITIHVPRISYFIKMAKAQVPSRSTSAPHFFKNAANLWIRRVGSFTGVVG